MRVQSGDPRQSVHRLSVPLGRLTALLAALSLASCDTDEAPAGGLPTPDTSASIDVAEGEVATVPDVEGPIDTPGDPDASDEPDVATTDSQSEDTTEIPDEAPPLPIPPPAVAPITCEQPPIDMASFDENATKIALALYHFNVQYVAGGLDNYLGAFTATDEEIQDAIIVESFEPIIGIFEKHPTWGADFEMQGLMLEVMGLRHPALLDRVRALANRGQIAIDSYHYSDQLVTAYPRKHMEWSWDENQRIFNDLCVTRSTSHFLQEGQFGPGIQAFAEEHNELVVLPRNLMKFFHQPPPPGAWFSNLGRKTITTDGANTRAIQMIWTFVDDGELLATAGVAPYLPEQFKKNGKAVADYEKQLTDLETAGWTIAPISHYTKILAARSIPPTPIDPPVLDGSWQPNDSEGMHIWMGGSGQLPGDERDNVVNTQNVLLGQQLLAIETLWAKVKADATLKTGDAEPALRGARRELMLAEVSDATGWRPVPTEVQYGLQHGAEARRLIDGVAKHLLWHLGVKDGKVAVDPLTGATSTPAPAPSGTTLSAPPAGLEGVLVTAERPHEAVWTQFTDYVELAVTFPATTEVVTGSEAPPLISVVFPMDTDEIAYSPGVQETVVVRAEHKAYKVIASGERLGLPLVNGLLELAPNRTLVEDLGSLHLAALIEKDTVTFEDRVQQSDAAVTWRFRVYAESAEAVLDRANALNIHPLVIFDVDTPG